MLLITEVEPLVQYIASGGHLSEERQGRLADRLAQALADGDGVIRITKDSGILLARRQAGT
jgi:hypothetical protein